MKVFKDQHFGDFYDQDSARVFSDLEFSRCTFSNSAISITRDPARRSTVRNVNLIDCSQQGCAVEAAVLEDVLVDGLKTQGLLQIWGAVFKHVTLRGRIGEVMFSAAIATASATENQQRAFDEARASFYDSVDWALDIRDAAFLDAEIQGIPSRLIRRDPKTQFVVTRQRALEGRWRSLDLSSTHWSTSVEFLLERGDPDVVLVAPKRHREYRQLLDGLCALREAGVAEPD